jgi:hypothetical protein
MDGVITLYQREEAIMTLVPHEQVQVLRDAVGQIVDSFVLSASRSAGDFAEVEEAARTAICELRRVLMSAGLQLSAAHSRQTYTCPTCAEALYGWSLSARRVVTAEGEASYSPIRYRCKRCEVDYYPLEEANGLSGSQFTTGAKAVVAEVAADRPYAHVAAALTQERGLTISAKEVDRTLREVAGWRAQEESGLASVVFGPESALLRAAGRDPLPEHPPLHGPCSWPPGVAALVSADGAMARSTKKGPQGLEWFECRGGLVAPVIPEGAGPESIGAGARLSSLNTVYCAGVCTPDTLFDRLGSCWRQRVPAGCTCVFVGDGARWIWDRVLLYFPDAVQVLDFYHACEHVGSAAAAWLGDGQARALVWKEEACRALLKPGGITRVLRDLLGALRNPERVADADALRIEVGYFLTHRHRMRYYDLKERGLPIGSGAMESGIKQLTASRLRQPGMKWTRAGADAVLHVRAAHLSGSLRLTTTRRHRDLQQRAQERYSPRAAMVA